MGNLCSIYHAHFDKLLSLTENHRKAVFLDKCLFWWQISTYTLGDEKIWFTRTIAEMAKELCVSERTVNRYLHEMDEKGFIERTNKLSASNKETFTVTKRLYIRISDKLLSLLKPSQGKEQSQSKSSFLPQNGVIENANLALSLYKEKEYNPVNNNIVTFDNRVKEQKKPSFQKVVFPSENHVANTIDEALNTQVKGMLFNVLKDKGRALHLEERLYHEVVFSITQTQQWPGITSPSHKINIIAALIRQNRWKTPKGFFNYAPLGAFFKTQEENKRRTAQEEKLARELLGVEDKTRIAEITARITTAFQDENRYLNSDKGYQQTRSQDVDGTQKLQEIEHELYTEGSYLETLERAKRRGELWVTEELITIVQKKLQRLYQEQAEMEKKRSDFERRLA